MILFCVQYFFYPSRYIDDCSLFIFTKFQDIIIVDYSVSAMMALAQEYFSSLSRAHPRKRPVGGSTKASLFFSVKFGCFQEPCVRLSPHHSFIETILSKSTRCRPTRSLICVHTIDSQKQCVACSNYYTCPVLYAVWRYL